MNPYDWIVFDSTGTLMRPDPEPASVYHSIGNRFAEVGSVDQVRRDLRAAMVRHFFGETAMDSTDESAELERWKRIVGDVLPGIRGARFDEAFEVLWHHFASAEAWRLFDDVLPTVDRLRRQGYSIAIASNFDRRLRQVLDGMGIADRFDQILISSDVGWSKPNRKFFEAAATRFGVGDPSRLLMVGDTPRGDVEAPRQVGWHARLLIREGDAPLLRLTDDL